MKNNNTSHKINESEQNVNNFVSKPNAITVFQKTKTNKKNQLVIMKMFPTK